MRRGAIAPILSAAVRGLRVTVWRVSRMPGGQATSCPDRQGGAFSFWGGGLCCFPLLLEELLQVLMCISLTPCRAPPSQTVAAVALFVSHEQAGLAFDPG